ncbi:MAG: TlyA family RNA methyltransferase [Bacillota bacterium]
MTVNRERIDVLLHDRGLFESRERAKASIMAGKVRVNGETVDKPGVKIPVDSQIEVIGGLPYVSRGGLKLEKALKSFDIDLKGKTVLDVGASTGGFTDCALQNGAVRVYAVDVGYGQLAWKLRSDPRVIAIERTNIKRLSLENLVDRPDFVVIDVSFISLEKVMPHISGLVSSSSRGVALIKPQFEAGREKVGKKGVVKDPDVHIEVINKVVKMIEDNGWSVISLDFSPIKGPEGNIEYLLYFDFSGPGIFDKAKIDKIVLKAHAEIKTN